MIKYLILFYFLFFASVHAQAQPGAAAPAVLSGGVGQESVAELRARQREFNTKFVFSLVEGNFISDVAVKITDGNGRVVLQQVSEGPILLVRLPAGQYEAALTHGSVTHIRKFALRGAGLHAMHLRWQRTAADGDPRL